MLGIGANSHNSDIILRQIKQNDDTSKFSLGDASYTPLKIFLRKNAYNFHQHEIAKTFVLVSKANNPDKILGYLTLMSSEIILDDKQRPQETLAAKRYETFPAAKIARLAIDKSLQGKGLGKVLLYWCINHIQLSTMPNIGCRFLVVDAKRDSISFYEKSGFTLLQSESNYSDQHPLMFFDLYRASFRSNLAARAINSEALITN